MKKDATLWIRPFNLKNHSPKNVHFYKDVNFIRTLSSKQNTILYEEKKTFL